MSHCQLPVVFKTKKKKCSRDSIMWYNCNSWIPTYTVSLGMRGILATYSIEFGHFIAAMQVASHALLNCGDKIYIPVWKIVSKWFVQVPLQVQAMRISTVILIFVCSSLSRYCFNLLSLFEQAKYSESFEFSYEINFQFSFIRNTLFRFDFSNQLF